MASLFWGLSGGSATAGPEKSPGIAAMQIQTASAAPGRRRCVMVADFGRIVKRNRFLTYLCRKARAQAANRCDGYGGLRLAAFMHPTRNRSERKMDRSECIIIESGGPEFVIHSSLLAPHCLERDYSGYKESILPVSTIEGPHAFGTPTHVRRRGVSFSSICHAVWRKGR